MIRPSRPNRVAPINLSDGSRRLIMCFDGTWNALESQTNVLRLFRSLASEETACNEQVTFYHRGVGTTPGTRISGGIFGFGVEANILRGYRWLVDNYRPGDPMSDIRSGELDEEDPLRTEVFTSGDLIFLTGFSRGAYTARSLAGLINAIGIIDRRGRGGENELADDAIDALITEGWKLYKTEPSDEQPRRYRPEFSEFRARYSHNAKIACVAVWDTVGALGMPTSAKFLAPLTAAGRHHFHDTKLGRTIEHAYHALAIDEHREDFRPTLWTLEPGEMLWAFDVEQRWFPGAHANVGGGYDDDLLCEAPLFWMAERIAQLGVHFRRDRETPPYRTVPPPEFQPDGSEHLSPVKDSYAAFMFGIYKLARRLVFKGPYERPVLVKSKGLNQTVDPSARLKWDVDPTYRPNNLAVAGQRDSHVPAIGRRDLAIAQGVAR